MLNHDTGQMDWDRHPIGGAPFPSSSYSINPENMYDMATPRGRELMDEVYPSSRRDGAPSEPHTSKMCFYFILFVMFLGFFVIPGHS